MRSPWKLLLPALLLAGSLTACGGGGTTDAGSGSSEGGGEAGGSKGTCPFLADDEASKLLGEDVEATNDVQPCVFFLSGTDTAALDVETDDLDVETGTKLCDPNVSQGVGIGEKSCIESDARGLVIFQGERVLAIHLMGETGVDESMVASTALLKGIAEIVYPKWKDAA